MGIAYRDLKAGKYYKGDHPSAGKMFLFVQQIAPHHPPNVQVTTWEVKRTKGAPLGTGTPSWVTKANQVLPGTQDSYMRREVTPAEVQQEGLPLVNPHAVPPYVAPPTSTPAPGSSPSTTRPSEAVAKAPTRSALPSKPPALRKDGTPKAEVKGNSTSKACLYCARPNKTLVLFSGSTNWCPDCEP